MRIPHKAKGAYSKVVFRKTLQKWSKQKEGIRCVTNSFLSMTGISMLCGESPPRRSYQRTLKRLASFTS